MLFNNPCGLDGKIRVHWSDANKRPKAIERVDAEILGGAKSMLIGNFIKNQFMVARDWPLGAAASTILTLLLALLIAVYRMANRKVASRDRMDEVA